MTKTVSEMSLSRRALTRAAALCMAMGVSACGVAYHSPKVQEIASDGAKVRVVPLTPETVLVANRSTYEPQALPSIFNTTAASTGSLRGAGVLPPTANVPERRPAALETRLPPAVVQGPYKIGVGDVIVLATPSGAQTSVEQLSGLLAAQNRRQGYTVQDDGAIAIPDVGRVKIAQMTLEEAEAEIFRALVENQINPTFSLEIAEFNSKKVSIGGAVNAPRVAPITLTPLYLDEALALVRRGERCRSGLHHGAALSSGHALSTASASALRADRSTADSVGRRRQCLCRYRIPAGSGRGLFRRTNPVG